MCVYALVCGGVLAFLQKLSPTFHVVFYSIFVLLLSIQNRVHFRLRTRPEICAPIRIASAVESMSIRHQQVSSSTLHFNLHRSCN